LPFSSEKLHTYLGHAGTLFGKQSIQTCEDNLGDHTVLRYAPEQGSGRWQASQLSGGETFQKPKPLFPKLEPSLVEEERARLGN
jgi:methionyl-tRNA synthetase